MMWNRNHLKDALRYSRISGSTLTYYPLHFWWAIKLAGLSLMWCFAMIVHAFLPPAFDFWVLRSIIDTMKKMKKDHPDDPLLKDIHFD